VLCVNTLYVLHAFLHPTPNTYRGPIVRLLVKRTKDSNNLIDGEQKFASLDLHTRANGLQNAYMATLFGSFSAKSFFGERKFVHNIDGNSNPP
jgi:hypothetical protein